MAIRDLLWACPLCRTVAGIQRAGREERCTACGASFTRGAGASIVARAPGGTIRRSAAEWAADLGSPHFEEPAEGDVVLGPEAATVKTAREERPLHHAGELLGFHELYGRRQSGSLLLDTAALRFTADVAEHSFTWPLQTLTVVQPESSALQVAAGTALASIRFQRSSPRLWTGAIIAVLRRLHARNGREVTAFQPLIRTRPVSAAPP